VSSPPTRQKKGKLKAPVVPAALQLLEDLEKSNYEITHRGENRWKKEW